MMLPGFGGYRVAGPESYENSAHTLLLANNTANACVQCHMGPALAGEYGGHTFRVSNDESGAINSNACIACHTTGAAALNALVDGSQATIDSLATVLEDILVARGLYNPTTEQNLKVEFKGHEAGALYNFKFVTEDKSRGVHNFKLSKALLTNSIASLQ